MIAEGHVALVGRLDRIESKVDVLATKVDVLEDFAVDTQRRLTGLEAFAVDTRRRLKRIEGHLHLNGTSARPKAKRGVPPKRGGKS